ncbi:MAG: substrate-binding domain-containing protein [Actinobacteria bacterium]|nr:substrate-binding domain-containing protein [Actinomycetota bacterium]
MKGRNSLVAVGGIVCVLVLGMLLGACGGGGSSSSSGSTSESEASETGQASTEGSGEGSASGESSGVSSAAFEEFSAPIKWPGPNTPVTPPPGKSITVIICGSQGITCVRVGEGVEAAGAAVGYKVKVVDGQSNPTVWNQAVQGAIAEKADGIVLAAVPPALVSGALEKASASGIKVAAALSVLGPPVDVKVELDRKAIAAANSAWIAKDSGGNAKVLVVRDDEFPETKVTSDAYKPDLEAECSGCTVEDEVEFTLALASQRLAGEVTQALKQHPEINYIVQPFDTITTFVKQGIIQAGKSGQVKIVGLGADPPSFEALAEGTMAQSLGTPAQWMGWDAVDGLIRTFAGKPVPKLNKETQSNYEVPERFVTAETPEPGPSGWPDFDYQSHFEELWGK